MEVLERKMDQASLKKSYKHIVWFYNLWSRLTESKAAKIALDLAEIEDGKVILEIACGTGIVFKQIVKKNPGGKNIGMDLSPDMLGKAKKRLKKVAGNFELKEGDVLALNFQDGSFDLVINNYMIDLMPAETFDKIAQEFHRVLKPNGIVIISTFSFGRKKIHKIWHWIAKKFPGFLTGCRPVSFGEYLMKAGFRIVKDLEISQNTFPSEIIKATKIA